MIVRYYSGMFYGIYAYSLLKHKANVITLILVTYWGN